MQASQQFLPPGQEHRPHRQLHRPGQPRYRRWQVPGQGVPACAELPHHLTCTGMTSVCSRDDTGTSGGYNYRAGGGLAGDRRPP
jgi:hypothetical protein